MRKTSTFVLLSAVSFLLALSATAQDFTSFESQQFRPLAMSPDGSQLFVTNTPDNRLEVFDISADGISFVTSVSVGLEPVAIAARTNSEIWVVNHLSDSISIVDLSGTEPRVVRTLLVGDEPRDIVFAGTGNQRAFITTAHRGQNSPYMDPDNVSEATTPGIGRADVWVFDALALGTELGGTPIEIVELFGDSPGALAVSPDGSKVYASVFKSGNQTTALSEGVVCDGGPGAGTCVSMPGEPTSPGGLPSPNEDADSIPQPEVGIIVKYDGSAWRDELNRDWSNQVRFNLPDLDVFSIDAAAAVPAQLQAFPSVGTVLFGMAVNPSSGNLYVTNTEALNEVRFLGPRTAGSSVTTVHGHFAESRITVIEPSTGSVIPQHLNKHIDYSVSPAPTSVRDASLSMPTHIAISGDGSTLYVAAKGSGKIGVFDTAELENDTFTPSPASHIQLSGGGPTGLVLDEARDRLYVLTRFDNTVSIIDAATASEGQRVALFNPEPATITEGRPYLYDAAYTSSNGEVSCASCHIAGDKDEIAWDLGNPFASVQNNPNPFKNPPAGDIDFHPIKGPMLTQTLRGIDSHGPLHFRGDQADPANPMDEVAAFMTINPAFVALMGRDAELTTEEMSELSDFVMALTPPPNPNRNLDFSLTPVQASGFSLYFSEPQSCGQCHKVNPGARWFGTSGLSDLLGTQAYKVSHLRNVYERIGMFGRPDTADVISLDPNEHNHMGDQIRGYGYLHDGSHDTLFRYNRLINLSFNNFDLDATVEEQDQMRRDVEQFQLVFPSNLRPVVGQQVTITANSTAATHARADLLITRAEVGDSELVVKGMIGGEARGWYLSAADTFTSDRSAEATLTDSALRAQANLADQELTYTAVPVGSGMRVGIDRDRDTVLDGDDNCPAAANPLQEDADGDSLGDACDPDTDGDGMPDEWEVQYGLDPLDPSDAAADGDGDYLVNLDEYNHSTNPNAPDSDSDWIKDGYEVLFLYSDPLSSDSDNDGMPDFWEGINWLLINDGTNGPNDPDGDGYTNLEEYQNGTKPRVFDAQPNAAPIVDAGPDQNTTLPLTAQLAGSVSDDGLPVPDEISLTWTIVSGLAGASISNASIADPIVSFTLPGTYVLRLTASDSISESADDVEITVSAGNDSDGDTMSDAWETTHSYNPYDAADALLDSDSDGLTNAEECALGSNPASKHSDSDWLGDGFEVNTLGTSPILTDTDGDTIDDRWEGMYGTGPTDPASGGYNPDGDAYTNLEEYINGTNPNSPDP